MTTTDIASPQHLSPENIATTPSTRAKIVCTLGPATATDERIARARRQRDGHRPTELQPRRPRRPQPNYTRVRAAAGRDRQGRRDPRGPAGPEDPARPLRRRADRVGRPAKWCGSPSRTCVGTHDRVSTTYKQLARDAPPGDRLLVDDGKVALVVTDVDGDDVVCRVTEGGPVSNNKGLSLPGMNVSVPALSDKDIDDLEFALRLGVDFIALSFVRSPTDVELVHEMMDRVGRAGPGDREDRETRSRRQSRSDRARLRRDHGRPRRPRASSCRSSRCRWCRSGPCRSPGRTPDR